MALTAGTVQVDVVPNTDKFAGQMQSRMSSIGSTLTKTVTPVAAGLAVAFKKSFDEWDAGIDSIRVSTGATGKALKGLETSMKNVAGKVTQPLSEVGKVMGQLAQRTNLTGKPLEHLTKQVLDLSRITGIDAQQSVAGLTRLFGDWSIKTKDMTGTMDRLFRASQATGIGVDKLSELMVQFGSPLRNLGLDFDTSAAMFAKFEKEGVNIQTMMPGLRMALKNFAAAGREPSVALQETFKEMQNATSESELMTIAFDTFGARAGPDMAAAVREGRFDLNELIGTMKNGSDTIAKATKDTTDLSDRFAMMRNRIVAVLGPFGEIGAIALSGVAAIGPLIMGIGALSTALKGSAVASVIAGTAMKAIPFVLIAAAVVTLAVLIFKNWDKIKEITLKVWGAIRDFLRNLWNRIKDIATNVFAAIVNAPRNAWEDIRNSTQRAWNSIRELLANVWDRIKQIVASGVEAVVRFMRELPGKVINAIGTLGRMLFTAAREHLGRFIDGLQDRAVGVLNFFKQLPGRISKAIGNLGRLLYEKGKQLVKGLIEGIIDAAEGIGSAIGGSISRAVKGLNPLGSGFADVVGIGGNLVQIGNQLKARGFQVAGHPAFPPIGGHTQGSYHYRGRAIDVNWPDKGKEPGILGALAGQLKTVLGGKIAEMFWPGYDPVGGHSGSNAHLHLAMDRGGLVRGPATVHIGRIKEDVAFIPRTGPGAGLGPTLNVYVDSVYGNDDLETTISRAFDRVVTRLGG